jgi:hypothetical protein
VRHSTDAVELTGQPPLPVYFSALHLQQTNLLSQRSDHDMKRAQVPSGSEASPEKRQRYEALPAADSQGHDDTSETRDEAVHEEPSTLCSRCSSIDVESLFVNMKGKSKPIKLMSLGKLGVEAELSSCSLCRLFYAVRIQDDDYPSVDDYALYVTAAPPPHRPWHGSVLAVVQETIDAMKHFEWLTQYSKKEGTSQKFIACSNESYTDRHAYSLRVRSIDARAIDFNILRDWVQLCVQHKRICIQDESSTSSLKDMKLIDCELRQIVPALSSHKYSALSYVWGTSKSGNEDQCVNDILPTTLPRTIEDAMSITKVLGLRYLWIDRYCIDQGNDTEKQIQIQQMDLIYQHAFVTIVAAAGTDPHFGLPGVSATSRTPQTTAWIKGRCLVSTLPDPRLLIKASKWMQRAWTYQENFFSTRRIVFTEQQVYYECRGGTANETSHDFQNSFKSFFLDANALSGDCPTYICRLLQEYCGRGLSVDSDAIRAFQGVFHNYWRRHHVHQYRGIPIIPSTKKGYLKDIHRSRGEAFAAGLTWSNTAPGTRRSLFPTWSWAGWTVPINYEGSTCQVGFKIGNERPLKVFIEGNDGSLSDMDELSDVLLDQSVFGSSSKFIHIEAWTIHIDLQYIPNADGESRSDGRWSNVNFGYVARFQSDEGAVEFPMHPLCQKHENDVTTQQSHAPHFEQGSLLGIVLGKCEDFSDLHWRGVIFIMIVQEKEHYHERVGHILLKVDPGEFRRNGYGIFESMIRQCRTIFRLKERRTIRLG